MSKRAAGFALFCAVVGIAVSAAAAYTHYHMLYDPSYRSFCDVSETVSCTQVYASRFSTFQGIPVAIFGALWFVVAALLSLLISVSMERFASSGLTSALTNVPHCGT